MYKAQPKILVVTRETRMEGLLKRWATKGQARFQFRRNRAAMAATSGDLEQTLSAEAAGEVDFCMVETEDSTYHRAVSELQQAIDFGVPIQSIDRAYLPTVDFASCAVVVVIGQDGLVANTAKYAGDLPIVGVNPDPERFDGVLLPFTVKQARSAVSNVLNGNARTRRVTLAEATLHDGQSLLAFNDFFVGARTHVSARYDIQWRGNSEPQSSSGILISTGAGSTGWMSSVFNMACGIADALGHSVDRSRVPDMAWDAPYLQWAVREPFRSRTSGISMICGEIKEGEVLTVESQMGTEGVIFSDGIESDFLPFTGGAIARIGVAKQRAKLAIA